MGMLMEWRQAHRWVHTSAYTGRQFNVSEERFRQTDSTSDGPRICQRGVTTFGHTGIRRWVCGIVLVCRLWQLVTKLDKIDHESVLSNTHVATQRKGYPYRWHNGGETNTRNGRVGALFFFFFFFFGPQTPPPLPLQPSWVICKRLKYPTRDEFKVEV